MPHDASGAPSPYWPDIIIGPMIMIVLMLFSDGTDVLMIHQLTIWRESVQKEVRHFLYTWIGFLELTAPAE